MSHPNQSASPRDAYRNLPEQILFLIDTHTELLLTMSEGSAWANAGSTRLDAFKSHLKRFISIKKMFGPHRFALGYLGETASYILDFTTSEDEFGFMLDHVLEKQSLRTCNRFNVGSIVEVVTAHVPGLLDPAAPLTYVTRVILVLSRTACELGGPTPEEARTLAALEASGRFYVDVLYMHDTKPKATEGVMLGTQDVYNRLNDILNPHDHSYSFEVGRASKRLTDSMTKLLAHPCQRVTPEEIFDPVLNRPVPPQQQQQQQQSLAPSPNPATSAAPSPNPSARASPEPPKKAGTPQLPAATQPNYF